MRKAVIFCAVAVAVCRSAVAEDAPLEINIEGGRAVQSNFHDFPVQRMNEAPRQIRIEIVDNDEPPGGAGEPGVPLRHEGQRVAVLGRDLLGGLLVELFGPVLVLDGLLQRGLGQHQVGLRGLDRGYRRVVAAKSGGVYAS